MVKGDKKQFLKWLGDGVQRGILSFPANGRVELPRVSLAAVFNYEKVEQG
jgi:hypothetical protein